MENNKYETRCNNYDTYFHNDDELELLYDGSEYYKGCPECQTDGYLMDLD